MCAIVCCGLEDKTRRPAAAFLTLGDRRDDVSFESKVRRVGNFRDFARVRVRKKRDARARTAASSSTGRALGFALYLVLDGVARRRGLGGDRAGLPRARLAESPS